MNFSPIQVEIPTLDLHENKKLYVFCYFSPKNFRNAWQTSVILILINNASTCLSVYRISALSVDTNNEKSSHSVESVPVDYGQAGSGSPEENISAFNITSRVEQALAEVFKLPPITNNPLQLSSHNQVTTSRSNENVNGISSSRERNRENRDLGNCSGSSVFSNMSYLGSSPGNSFFLEQLSCDHYCQSGKKEVPDADDSQFNFPTNDTLEDGYQSFSSVLEKGNDADVCVNLSGDVGTDEKCIMKNLITSTNPLYPSLILNDGSVTPTDEGHPAFPGLTKSTKGEWSTSVSTEQALNAWGALKFPKSTGQDPTSVQQSSWATSLHISPVIQMDSSYHCV